MASNGIIFILKLEMLESMRLVFINLFYFAEKWRKLQKQRLFWAMI
jgi:hypothetical protein